MDQSRKIRVVFLVLCFCLCLLSASTFEANGKDYEMDGWTTDVLVPNKEISFVYTADSYSRFSNQYSNKLPLVYQIEYRIFKEFDKEEMRFKFFNRFGDNYLDYSENQDSDVTVVCRGHSRDEVMKGKMISGEVVVAYEYLFDLKCEISIGHQIEIHGKDFVAYIQIPSDKTEQYEKDYYSKRYSFLSTLEP